MSFAYVANKGTHLYESQSLNQIPDAARALPVSTLNSKIGSSAALAAGVVAPFPGFVDLWGSRATVAQALRPFPQYNNVNIYGSTYGNSNYHSFQYSLTKRWSHGLSGTAAYTYSKFLTDARQFDGFVAQQSAYQREKSYHPTDLPHIFTFSASYDLPFGQGHSWASTGVASKVFGGWQVAAVGSYNSGSRLSVTTNNNLPYFNPARRPDIVSENIRTDVSMSEFDPTVHYFLNRDAFANPPTGQFGSAPRYLHERGPMRLEESFAVIKNTTIGERVTHQFRVEAQNPFNRTVFGNPNPPNTTSNAFGRITSTQVGPRNIQFGMKLIWQLRLDIRTKACRTPPGGHRLVQWIIYEGSRLRIL